MKVWPFSFSYVVSISIFSMIEINLIISIARLGWKKYIQNFVESNEQDWLIGVATDPDT